MQPLNIFIAEDNDDHAELLIDNFAELCPGHIMTRFKDGEELLGTLHKTTVEGQQHTKPQLILLDLKMPKVNGLEALREIKQNAALKSIPVLMITSSAYEDDIKESYSLGANTYLVKPSNYEELVSTLRKLNAYWASVAAHAE